MRSVPRGIAQLFFEANVLYVVLDRSLASPPAPALVIHERDSSLSCIVVESAETRERERGRKEEGLEGLHSFVLYPLSYPGPTYASVWGCLPMILPHRTDWLI